MRFSHTDSTPIPQTLSSLPPSPAPPPAPAGDVRDMLRGLQGHQALATVPATNMRDSVVLHPPNDSRTAEMPAYMDMWLKLVGRGGRCLPDASATPHLRRCCRQLGASH